MIHYSANHKTCSQNGHSQIKALKKKEALVVLKCKPQQLEKHSIGGIQLWSFWSGHSWILSGESEVFHYSCPVLFSQISRNVHHSLLILSQTIGGAAVVRREWEASESAPALIRARKGGTSLSVVVGWWIRFSQLPCQNVPLDGWWTSPIPILFCPFYSIHPNRWGPAHSMTVCYSIFCWYWRPWMNHCGFGFREGRHIYPGLLPVVTRTVRYPIFSLRPVLQLRYWMLPVSGSTAALWVLARGHLSHAPLPKRLWLR